MSKEKREVLGQRIQIARLKKGFTQEELGALLEINGKSVSKWERGVAVPSLEHLYKICIILEISLDELLDIQSSPVR